MKTTVTVDSPPISSPRVRQVSAMADLPPELRNGRTWELDVPIEERDWNVGLIVGPSGAGKSRCARALFGDQLVDAWPWDPTKAVVDCFPADMGIRDITGLLMAVGFGATPGWIRPYQTLSNGEQFRVDCARALAETAPGRITVMDEFTSVVDRHVAQVASHTVGKHVRRSGRRFVAVTCHYDIIDWLQPDWVLQPHAEEFTWRSVQPRPQVVLDVCSVDRTAWRVFHQHHYLSGAHATTATCFGGFVEGECVAFASYLHQPMPKAPNMKITHRVVVLPDWQGLGIGARLNEVVGERLAGEGQRYIIVTAHPGMIAGLNRSTRWRYTGRATSAKRDPMQGGGIDARQLNTCGFEYVPVGMDRPRARSAR